MDTKEDDETAAAVVRTGRAGRSGCGSAAVAAASGSAAAGVVGLRHHRAANEEIELSTGTVFKSLSCPELFIHVAPQLSVS